MTRRVRLLAVATLALLSPLRALRAQDIQCDPNEKEVRSLRFEGNEHFSSDILSARVLVTPSSLLRRYLRVVGTKRCYPDVGLKPDVAALKQFYRNNGFYDATIDTIVKPLGPEAVGVTFRIGEGPPMIVDSLTITGLDSVPNATDIVRDLQLAPGNRYGIVSLIADRDSIVTRLRNDGYPQADVFPGTTTDTVALRAEVDLDVQAGPRARIGAIEVRSQSADGGRPEIDSAVVLHLLGFGTGDRYTARALADGQRNLYQLGAYRHVGISLDTTARAPDSLAAVLVDLREDYMHEYYQQEGWGNLDCFRANAQYTDKNFLRRALHLQLTGTLSKIGYGAPTDWPALRNLCYRHDMAKDSIASSKLNYHLGATVTEPTLFGTHWVPSYSAYTERRGEYEAYLRTTQLGLDVAATRDIAFTTPLRFGYTFEFGRTQAQPAVLCAVFARCSIADQADIQRQRPLAIASASIQQNRTDNTVDPSRGWFTAAEIRTAQGVIGSDPSLRFIKGTVDGSTFYPLGRRSVLMFRLRAGWIGGNPNLPPPQERLYAGGANSVRGYQQNELGSLVYLLAQDQLDSLAHGDSVAYVAKSSARPIRAVPVGGNSLIVANVELRLRDPFFPDLLQYVLFTDGGQVWTRQIGAHNLELGKFAITPGVGVRYFSPFGPVQVNAGYNPTPSRVGPAYYLVSPNGSSQQQPLICVTAANASPVFAMRDPATGVPVSPSNDCPATFAPPTSTRFLSKFKLTISVGTGF